MCLSLLILAFPPVIFGEYPYANEVLPFCKDVYVQTSIVQPNADNCSDVYALEYNMLFVVIEGFIKFPLIIKLLILL